ncbi:MULTISPECIES: hypothetical protein [Streptomyces]|uniref:Uncharacterized protein n=1 Tax=Streptomyces fimbriatus TaxID=68197 RepID=A0ABW0DEJ2_STRFI
MGHLVTDPYGDMLRRAGVLAYGTPGRVARPLDEYRAAGVDEVVLSPAGVVAGEGAEAALAGLDGIVRAACG